MAISSEHSTQENTQAPSQSPPVDLYENLSAYPFETDLEFAKGLSIILGHPESPATCEEISRDDDLVLQAKCFYFSRKEKLPAPLSVAAYKTWLECKNLELRAVERPISQAMQRPDEVHQAIGPPHEELNTVNGTNQAPSHEPTYPSSFAHIVELITTGQPVPGVQQIPDTVLAGQDSASTKLGRRKPWEKEEKEEKEEAAEATDS